MRIIILFLFILLLVLLLFYVVFFPHRDAIYLDNEGAQVKVLNVTLKTVVIQYVKYDPESGSVEELTNPLSVSLWEFLKEFEFWILL